MTYLNCYAFFFIVLMPSFGKWSFPLTGDMLHHVIHVSHKNEYHKNKRLNIGGSKGGRQGRAPPPGGPNSFIFMQFLAKKLQNNSTFGSWRPLLGEILDPPLLNVVADPRRPLGTGTLPRSKFVHFLASTRDAPGALSPSPRLFSISRGFSENFAKSYVCPWRVGTPSLWRILNQPLQFNIIFQNQDQSRMLHIFSNKRI